MDKYYRTLLRVTDVGANGSFSALLPALSENHTFSLNLAEIPEELHQHVRKGERFFVRANIGSPLDKIQIINFEFRP